jgi:hypothetical protein
MSKSRTQLLIRWTLTTTLSVVALTGCLFGSSAPPTTSSGTAAACESCSQDGDCKGDLICENGACITAR